MFVFFRGAVGEKFVFMDDNATCHRTLAVQDCLDSEGIQRLVWPARSPDLNPIENLWEALGRQVGGRNYPPTNKNTLIRALTEEWDNLPQQLLDMLRKIILPIREYRLTNITFGTSSAPFFATRTLRQLAIDGQENYPAASRVILCHFYVDDLLSGSDTRKGAIKLVLELQEMMKRGGFSLRKWVSNDPGLLANISEEYTAVDSKHTFKDEQPVKILGIAWLPEVDKFSFTITVKESNVSTKRKNHPIFLPKTDHVVNFIITDFPLKLLHAGPQLLQAALREKFWTLLVRDVVRRVMRRCIPCFRIRPRFAEQFMGDLPESRVCSSSVFQRTGNDFAGPFLIRNSKGRGSRITKRNICVFVCLATKAVHLKVISGLTSEILCDKGTNFYGASTYLRKEFYQLLKEDAVHKFLVTNNITFDFNPLSAPHFGGI
ncbi:integrase catalytic domain-containing protein [Trichonephila clavipes]|nr:integrase catalytic domain-containing protein [Trichonephila clavipes]